MNEQLKAVIVALSQLIEPRLKWQIGQLNLIKDVSISGEKLLIKIDLVTDDANEKQLFRDQVFEAVAPFQFQEIDLRLNKVHVGKHGLQGVKEIILVGSGKGGVGKSTVAANLAASLKLKGYSVGVMDADIYGPSVPILFGNKNKPQVLAEEMIMPVEAHGIKLISIGNLVSPEDAISWRAQLVTGTILQFIRKVNWGQLDYLIVDMPPGTGDIQLTIAKELKVRGVVVVSMPQQVVIGDVKRSLTLYHEKEIPVLGVVQNMVSYACEACGHEQRIFPAGSEQLAGVEEIAALPLVPEFCDSGNLGIPYVMQKQEGVIYEQFMRLTEILAPATAESVTL